MPSRGACDDLLKAGGGEPMLGSQHTVSGLLKHGRARATVYVAG